jgi:hypothetical protein
VYSRCELYKEAGTQNRFLVSQTLLKSSFLIGVSLQLYVACRNTYRYLELLLMHMRTFKSCHLISLVSFLQRWAWWAQKFLVWYSYAYFIESQLFYEKSCRAWKSFLIFTLTQLIGAMLVKYVCVFLIIWYSSKRIENRCRLRKVSTGLRTSATFATCTSHI